MGVRIQIFIVFPGTSERFSRQAALFWSGWLLLLTKLLGQIRKLHDTLNQLKSFQASEPQSIFQNSKARSRNDRYQSKGWLSAAGIDLKWDWMLKDVFSRGSSAVCWCSNCNMQSLNLHWVTPGGCEFSHAHSNRNKMTVLNYWVCFLLRTLLSLGCSSESVDRAGLRLMPGSGEVKCSLGAA